MDNSNDGLGDKTRSSEMDNSGEIAAQDYLRVKKAVSGK